MVRADSTISLRSSLYQGVSENGRMYHRYKEGSMFMRISMSGCQRC